LERVVEPTDPDAREPAVRCFSHRQAAASRIIVNAHRVNRGGIPEYSVAAIPVSTQHFPMLQRNLIYTGITRAEAGRAGRPGPGAGHGRPRPALHHALGNARGLAAGGDVRHRRSDGRPSDGRPGARNN
jgi:hypothetical protein